MRLHNRVALVTGSATGIGRATTLALAAEGADVVVNYSRSETEARETAAAVEALGRRALLARADVADDGQVRAMVARAAEAFGRLDILVNNAGTTHRVSFTDLEGLTEEMWDRIMAVNARGIFFCSRAAAGLLKQARGCIVNVASDSGLRPEGSSIAYCASKAAALSLTGTLAVALAPDVRVNAVAPGYVDTRWLDGRRQVLDRAREASLLKRNCTPEDVAEVIVGLVAGAGFVTGQTILIDGGEYR